MKRILSLILTLTLLLGCMTGLAKADGAQGKYVSDVFIAYGRTEDEARTWLTNNGWEPIRGNGDFCAGKNSTWDSPIAAVMGIRRTDDANDAVTDMAVMNMSGGYSFPDYADLLNKKKAEIDEFVSLFMPVIEEYRRNCGGQGSAFGKLRAEQVKRLLNKFYDGGAAEPYAKNDTGLPIGDLLLAKTRQEGNAAGGDLQQIILESNGAALLAVENLLALAADTGEETWLQRLGGLTGRDLAKNIAKYVPEAAGQNLAGSAIDIFLRERFGDAARILAEQWAEIQEGMLWFEDYCDENDLWRGDDETDEGFQARTDQFFADLKETNPVAYEKDFNRFMNEALFYGSLYEIPYKGEWGDTLGDFFNPFNGKRYGQDDSNFLTFAAALSPGQRVATNLVSLKSLLLAGFADEQSFRKALPDLDTVFGGEDTMSVYTGVKRQIFRSGVALTSRARMEQTGGHGNPFDELFDLNGTLSILSFSAFVLGATLIIGGAVAPSIIPAITKWQLDICNQQLSRANDLLYKSVQYADWDEADRLYQIYEPRKPILESRLENKEQLTSASKVVACIGAVIMIVAACIKGYQLYQCYQRKFTMIPLMIVDEADIVTYSIDADGNEQMNINFDQYEYYEAVKCNRQQMGEISDWQSGVSDYQSWGCGDVADLNGDFGQEWLALYTVKSPKKGNPILADSLVLQYGSSEAPRGTDGKLHKFTYTNAMDLGDTAYSFNNDKNGVYFFWSSDPKAYDVPGTASAFTRGQMAMSGAAGLIIGVLGATLALYPKRKKEDPLLP